MGLNKVFCFKNKEQILFDDDHVWVFSEHFRNKNC